MIALCKVWISSQTLIFLQCMTNWKGDLPYYIVSFFSVLENCIAHFRENIQSILPPQKGLKDAGWGGGGGSLSPPPPKKKKKSNKQKALLEFPEGLGGGGERVGQILEKKSRLRGRYGYFLELHIVGSLLSVVHCFVFFCFIVLSVEKSSLNQNSSISVEEVKEITQPQKRALVFCMNPVKTASWFQFLVNCLVHLTLENYYLDEGKSSYLKIIFEH